MDSSKKIYLVTSGSYSDYHVVSAWSTAEKAQHVAEANGDMVEEYEIDPTSYELPDGMFIFNVNFSRDGDVLNVGLYDQDRVFLGDYREGLNTIRESWTYMDVPQPYSRVDCYHVRVLARDEQHAVKIMGDLRRQAIADGTITDGLGEDDEKPQRLIQHRG